MEIVKKVDARPGDWAVVRGKSWIEDMEKISEIKTVVLPDGEECKVVVVESGCQYRFDNGKVVKGIAGRVLVSVERGEL